MVIDMARMKLKNNKKKKVKFRYVIYLLIIYLSFSLTYYVSMKGSKIISNKEFINLLLEEGDLNNLYHCEPTRMVSKTMNFLFDIDISKPVTVLNNTILKYGGKNNNVSLEVEEESENITLEEAMKASDYIENPNKEEVDDPVVYLYNSHQLENYSSEYLEIYGIKPNVQMASYLFREKLNEKGIKTIVEDTDITSIIKKNNYPYYKSYDITRNLIKEKMKKYSSLKYFIDIHRDAVSKSAVTVNIDNKYYAKVLFVLGLEYDTYQDNLTLMTELNNRINEAYPGLSRGIIKKEGKNVNGRYNQDINANVILIEIGSNESTIEEVYNTFNVLTEVLGGYIKDNNG